MINKIDTEFISQEKVEFILDDDKELSWLAHFENTKFDRFFLFIDSNVKNLWGTQILNQLQKHNKNIFELNILPIEESKSITFYPKAIEFLEKNKCGRYDLVIAIGGGIVLDLVSFVVSTYMRGVPLFMIPTTLIGQTDASTAGKTCLNSMNSKNLLGTFYYPKIVYNNINFLFTNSNRFLRQGFSEAFKYGLLNSSILIDKLLEFNKNNKAEILQDIIRFTIESRIAIRQKDALASNLGHTFGHAIEKISNFKILHGDAISAGTVIALNYAEHIGILDKETKNNIINLMKRLGLNLYIEKTIKSEKLVEMMMLDKKSSSRLLYLVLIKDISIPYEENGRLFRETKPEDIKLFLDVFLANYKYVISDCDKLLQEEFINYD